MNRTLITNDCLAYFIYQKIGEEYLSPFIGSLFEDDKQYVKFCKYYKDYIKMIPVFGKAKLPVTKMDYQEFPIMFLGDIEIHWPHENNGPEFLMEKFNRRLARVTDPLFIWSDMQVYNVHEQADLEQQKSIFRDISVNLFVNKDDIEVHRSQSMDDRNGDGYLRCVKWLDYNLMADHVLRVLGEEPKSGDIHFQDSNT